MLRDVLGQWRARPRLLAVMSAAVALVLLAAWVWVSTASGDAASDGALAPPRAGVVDTATQTTPTRGDEIAAREPPTPLPIPTSPPEAPAAAPASGAVNAAPEGTAPASVAATPAPPTVAAPSLPSTTVAPAPPPQVTAVPTPLVTPVPKALATPVPAATASPALPTAAPAASGRFVTLPPFAPLPSGAECAARVRRSPFEPRPQNYAANHTVPSLGSVSIGGVSAGYNAKIAGRIDGNFTGTTDEIIQWASCKWGFAEDLTRARAVVESWWIQSTGGDVTSSASTCAQVGKRAPCAESYGLLQIRFPYHPGTYPHTERSTAFTVDYALAWMRACFEGDLTWLGGSYRAGDERGCVGTWFAGNWYSSGAQTYIGRVEGELASRTWEQPGF